MCVCVRERERERDYYMQPYSETNTFCDVMKCVDLHKNMLFGEMSFVKPECIL